MALRLSKVASMTALAVCILFGAYVCVADLVVFYVHWGLVGIIVSVVVPLSLLVTPVILWVGGHVGGAIAYILASALMIGAYSLHEKLDPKSQQSSASDGL